MASSSQHYNHHHQQEQQHQHQHHQQQQQQEQQQQQQQHPDDSADDNAANSPWPLQTRRGASSVEVYGFVGWIASAVALALWCAWAFTPGAALHRAGITYFPDKQWALIIPAWLIACVLFVYWSYESLNMMSVPAPDDVRTVCDARSKWVTQLGRESGAAATDRSLPPLVHMPAPLVSEVLYGGGRGFREAESALFAATRRRQQEQQQQQQPSV